MRIVVDLDETQLAVVVGRVTEAVLARLEAERSPRLLPVKEAAPLLGLSEKALYVRCSRGELPCYRTGARVLVDPAEARDVMRRG